MDWAAINSWPLNAFSQRINGPVHQWHAQIMGCGPEVLLLHGAGGATHSFRAVMPILAEQYRVIALDLPGHGFTRLGTRTRSGLPAMAEDVTALMAQENWNPVAVIGHSAGAAIALQMARHRSRHVIGINAALGEFPGLAKIAFPAMAKALSLTPFVPNLFSIASANPTRVRTLIRSTGSSLDEEGYRLYQRLLADSAHVNGALQMMAQWELRDLLRALPELTGPVDLIAGTDDRTVLPSISERASSVIPKGKAQLITGLGHLMHEEQPEDMAALLRQKLEAR